MKANAINSSLSSGVIVAAIALAAFVGIAALIARADTAPTITNAIQNSSNTIVTSAAIGTSVHDMVTVASSTSSITPTGTVNFNVYGNTTCSGTPSTQSGVALVGGVANSANTIVPASGLSYTVNYGGDASTSAATSACQALTATSGSVGISQSLSTTTFPAGFSIPVTDSSTLTNTTANATGTVAYNYYINNQCVSGAQSAGTKVVSNGIVPNSDSIQFNTVGNFYWQAVYSGDQNNSGATSSCAPVIVVATSTPVTPPATTTPGTISGNIFNDVNKNDVKDAGDSNLSGWTVWLHLGTKKDGYNNPIVKTATTDANGNYSFANLTLGSYFVEEQEQAGWNQTSDDMKVILDVNHQSGTVNFANVMKSATSTNNGHHGDGDNDNGTSTKNGHDNGNHNGWFKNFLGHFNAGLHLGQIKNGKDK